MTNDPYRHLRIALAENRRLRESMLLGKAQHMRLGVDPPEQIIIKMKEVHDNV